MNNYDKTIHHRKSIRLKGYDYSSAGLYFITICCQDMVNRFGEVVKGEMILNVFGQIANKEWIKLAERFVNFELDVFQIMPNHMHGIIKLNEPPVGSGFTPDLTPTNETPTNETPTNETPTNETQTNETQTNETPTNAIEENQINASIPDIIGAYKSIVSNSCLEIYKSRNQMMGKLWQRSYHERIIRDEKAYQNISNYIINNPKKWDEDEFYKK